MDQATFISTEAMLIAKSALLALEKLKASAVNSKVELPSDEDQEKAAKKLIDNF